MLSCIFFQFPMIVMLRQPKGAPNGYWWGVGQALQKLRGRFPDIFPAMPEEQVKRDQKERAQMLFRKKESQVKDAWSQLEAMLLRDCHLLLGIARPSPQTRLL